MHAPAGAKAKQVATLFDNNSRIAGLVLDDRRIWGFRGGAHGWGCAPVDPGGNANDGNRPDGSDNKAQQSISFFRWKSWKDVLADDVAKNQKNHAKRDPTDSGYLANIF